MDGRDLERLGWRCGERIARRDPRYRGRHQQYRERQHRRRNARSERRRWRMVWLYIVLDHGLSPDDGDGPKCCAETFPDAARRVHPTFDGMQGKYILHLSDALIVHSQMLKKDQIESGPKGIHQAGRPLWVKSGHIPATTGTSALPSEADLNAAADEAGYRNQR